MATITKSIRISAVCKKRISGLGGDCISSVSGDTDYCSYTTTTSGVGTPTNCSTGNADYTPCLVGMNGEPVFKSVTWDASLTSDGHTYTRISTTGGSNSSFASATYEYNESEPEPEPVYYTLTVKHYLESTSNLYTTKTHSILEGTRVNPSSYAISITDYTLQSTQPSSSFTMSSNRTINILYKSTATTVTVYIWYYQKLGETSNIIDYTSFQAKTSEEIYPQDEAVSHLPEGYEILSVEPSNSFYPSTSSNNNINVYVKEKGPCVLTFKVVTASGVGVSGNGQTREYDYGTEIDVSALASEWCPDGYRVVSYSPSSDFTITNDRTFTITVESTSVRLTINYLNSRGTSVGTYNKTYNYGDSVSNILSLARTNCPAGYEVTSVVPPSISSITSNTTVNAYVSEIQYTITLNFYYSGTLVGQQKLSANYGSTFDPETYGKVYCPDNYEYSSASRGSFTVTDNASVSIYVTPAASVSGSAKVSWRRGNSYISGELSGSFSVSNYTGTVYLSFSSKYDNATVESYNITSSSSITISGTMTQGMQGNNGWAGGGFSKSGGTIYVFNDDEINIGSFTYTAEAIDAAVLDSGSATIEYTKNRNGATGTINGSFTIRNYTGYVCLSFNSVYSEDNSERYYVSNGVAKSFSGTCTTGISGSSGWAGGAFGENGGNIYVYLTTGVYVGSFKYTSVDKTPHYTLESGTGNVSYRYSTSGGSSVNGTISGTFTISGGNGTAYLSFEDTYSASTSNSYSFEDGVSTSFSGSVIAGSSGSSTSSGWGGGGFNTNGGRIYVFVRDSSDSGNIILLGSFTYTATDTTPEITVSGSGSGTYEVRDSYIAGSISGSFRVTGYTGDVYLTFSKPLNTSELSSDSRFTVSDSNYISFSGTMVNGMSGTSGFGGGNFSTTGGTIYVYTYLGISLGSFKYTMREIEPTITVSGSASGTFYASQSSISASILGSVRVTGYSGDIDLSFNTTFSSYETINVISGITSWFSGTMSQGTRGNSGWAGGNFDTSGGTIYIRRTGTSADSRIGSISYTMSQVFNYSIDFSVNYAGSISNKKFKIDNNWVNAPYSSETERVTITAIQFKTTKTGLNTNRESWTISTGAVESVTVSEDNVVILNVVDIATSQDLDISIVYRQGASATFYVYGLDRTARDKSIFYKEEINPATNSLQKSVPFAIPFGTGPIYVYGVRWTLDARKDGQDEGLDTPTGITDINKDEWTSSKGTITGGRISKALDGTQIVVIDFDTPFELTYNDAQFSITYKFSGKVIDFTVNGLDGQYTTDRLTTGTLSSATGVLLLPYTMVSTFESTYIVQASFQTNAEEVSDDLSYWKSSIGTIYDVSVVDYTLEGWKHINVTYEDNTLPISYENPPEIIITYGKEEQTEFKCTVVSNIEDINDIHLYADPSGKQSNTLVVGDNKLTIQKGDKWFTGLVFLTTLDLEADNFQIDLSGVNIARQNRLTKSQVNIGDVQYYRYLFEFMDVDVFDNIVLTINATSQKYNLICNYFLISAESTNLETETHTIYAGDTINSNDYIKEYPSYEFDAEASDNKTINPVTGNVNFNYYYNKIKEKVKVTVMHYIDQVGVVDTEPLEFTKEEMIFPSNFAKDPGTFTYSKELQEEETEGGTKITILDCRDDSVVYETAVYSNRQTRPVTEKGENGYFTDTDPFDPFILLKPTTITIYYEKNKLEEIPGEWVIESEWDPEQIDVPAVNYERTYYEFYGYSETKRDFTNEWGSQEGVIRRPLEGWDKNNDKIIYVNCICTIIFNDLSDEEHRFLQVIYEQPDGTQTYLDNLTYN